MTDAERLRAIEAVFSSAKSLAKVMLAIQDILDAAPKISIPQPDPHPLGSVRFDEARAKQDKHKDFLEFFGAHGFEFEMDRSFYIAGKKAKRASLEFGVDVFGSVMVGAIRVKAETFGEALRLLNEVAGTEMMGGWA
jgi:hypothetical protein